MIAAAASDADRASSGVAAPSPEPEPVIGYFEELELVVEDFKRLREFRFRRDLLDAFIVKIEDLRAWSNSEFLETQHDRELKDWAHWERIGKRFDQRYIDPNDVLLEADRIRKERAANEVLLEVERRQRAARKTKK